MEKDFEAEVLTRLTKIETKLDDYSRMRDKTETAFNLSKENEREITELQEKIKWITRTVTGAIITGLIGILFLFLKSGMGVN